MCFLIQLHDTLVKRLENLVVHGVLFNYDVFVFWKTQEGKRLGYGSMQGIPMIASSPVRHESPLGMNPVEVQSYQPPWKALSDFALHTDLDRIDTGAPPFQQLVNQVCLLHTLFKSLYFLNVFEPINGT